MQLLNKIIHYLDVPFPHYKKVWLFRRFIYLWFVFFLTPTILNWDLLGAHAGGFSVQHSHWYSDLMHVIFLLPAIEGFESTSVVFLIVLVSALITGFIGFMPTISAVLVYWSYSVLALKQGDAANGGNFVVQALLLYTCLLPEKPMLSINFAKRISFQFLFRLAQFFVLIVYMTAAAYKITGTDWLQGSAFYYTSQSIEYAHPLTTNYLFNNDFVWYSANYFGFAYQLLFPVLVWIKPIKKWLLWAGVFFHFTIAITVGIFDFGIGMIVAYTLFLPHETVEKLYNRANQLLSLKLLKNT